MKIWYVYELYNLAGTIEWVGETINPKSRLYSHTKRKHHPTNGNGKFYGRTDITMNIVAQFDNRPDAWKYQCQLQKEHGLQTDGEAYSKCQIGKIVSAETKIKMSVSQNGKTKSAETKKKISEARKVYWAKQKENK